MKKSELDWKINKAQISEDTGLQCCV